MSVSLSPIGGVAAQFFDNNGNVLAGGKLYSYEAGTTTPKTTYTSLAGTIANSNPIILNSAGRVPLEVWLTTGDSYKFVLTDSVGNQIGTWDNVYGYSSGSVAYAATETQTATADQSVFVLTEMQYTVGTNTLAVYVDGVNQVVNNAYVESGPTTVTFVVGLHVGATVKFVNITSASVDASTVTYEQGGAGAVATTVQAKLRETVSVKDFGAVGDGVTDDSAAILSAFEYLKSVGGGTLDFPYGEYLIGYGFRISSNITVNLNGSTIKATTTFGQGSVPASTEVMTSAFFALGRPNSESPLAADIGNVVINGSGALLDGRRDEQTGTPGGYTLIVLETTDTPAQVDFLKLKNIVIQDLEMDRSGYDGIYIAGAYNVTIENVTIRHALRIGFTGIGGELVSFINCQAINTVGDNPDAPVQGPGNSGDGFWNEPNNAWQNINKWSYVNCKAIGNYQSGFKVWNAGADAQYHIQLDNCYAYYNVYNEITGLLRSAPGEAGFIISTNGTSSSQAMITFNNCIAEAENGSGFIINPTGGGTSQRFVLNNCVAFNCNQNDTDSINRTPIRIGDSAYTATPTIIINNPVVIAPNGNSLGYGIYSGSMQNVYITNPVFVGTFTQGLIINTTYAPASNERAEAMFDAGNNGPDLGVVYKFPTPVRPALFDQTAEPSASTDIFRNEVVMWQDDNNQFTGIYRRDDSTTPKYINLNNKKRIRAVVAYGGTTLAANDVVGSTATVTGAALGDYVQMSYTQDNVNCILWAYVESADTVRWNLYNPSTTTSRVIPSGYVVLNVFGTDV